VTRRDLGRGVEPTAARGTGALALLSTSGGGVKADLDAITSEVNAKQKAAHVTAYVSASTPLVQQGWLTAAQSSLSSNLARQL
jgi:hypothetical protein